MAVRTTVTAQKMAIGDNATDVAEVAVAIDAANGMRVAITKGRHVLIRITNTHASPHQVTMVASTGGAAPGNSKAAYGAAGPSIPAEPDFVGIAVPATTGVRYISPSSRFFRSDGSFWLNFEAAHTGFVSALEFA